MESYLDELTAMLARSEEYLVYVQKRLRDCEAAAAAAATATTTASAPVSPRESTEGVRSQEGMHSVKIQMSWVNNIESKQVYR